jgi:cytochrome P450
MEFPNGPDISTAELIDIFLSNPFPFLQDCHDKYGSVFTLNLGTFNVDDYDANGKWVFLSNPEHIKKVFHSPSETVQAGAANNIQFQKLIPQQGSVAIDGKDHLTRRRTLSKTVIGSRKVDNFTASVYKITSEAIKQFPTNSSFLLSERMRDISNKVMQNSLFGSEAKSVSSAIHNHLCDFGKPDMGYDGKLAIINRCRKELADKVDHYKQCPIRKTTEDSPALFTTLLNPENSDTALTEIQIKDELMTLLLGGADTTASMMTWTFAWLLSHPEIYKKLKKEIETVLASEAISDSNIDQLTYLDAVVKEVCRISPALFTTSTRLLLKPLNLDKQTIPAGTIVAHCAYLVHMNPAFYPEPKQFKPERFLGITADPFRWIPFGGGIRRCIGMNFALYEMRTVVATIVQRVDLEAMQAAVEPEMQGSFFAPHGGVEVQIKGRI